MTPFGQNMAIFKMAAESAESKMLTFAKIDIERCMIAQMKGIDAHNANLK